MPDLYERKTYFGSMTKEESAHLPGGSPSQSQGMVNVLTYSRDGPAGSTRTLKINEEGLVTLSGKQPEYEAYGLEDSSIQYQAHLSDFDKEGLLEDLEKYDIEDEGSQMRDYYDLEELLVDIEEEALEVL